MANLAEYLAEVWRRRVETATSWERKPGAPGQKGTLPHAAREMVLAAIKSGRSSKEIAHAVAEFVAGPGASPLELDAMKDKLAHEWNSEMSRRNKLRQK